MSKPKVAILGHVNSAEITSDIPIDITHFGYAHVTIPRWDSNPQVPRQMADDHDLIIIQDCGGGCWHYRKQLTGLKGHRAKVVFWSYDSHHEHVNEKANSDLFDAIATAHSWTVPLIGPTAFWCPCSLVLHSPNEISRHCSQERWFDFGFVGRRYAIRDKVMTDWRSWFECMNKKVFCGEADPISLAWLYNRCKAVFNISYSDDLNIRFFEGLAAGCLVLMTECTDIHHSRFEDLLTYVAIVPRDIDYHKFKTTTEQLLSRNAGSAVGIIFRNHTLINRYCEIATRIL